MLNVNSYQIVPIFFFFSFTLKMKTEGNYFPTVLSTFVVNTQSEFLKHFKEQVTENIPTVKP